MANIDKVQLPDGTQYNVQDTTSQYATETYVQQQVASINKQTIGLGNVDNTSDLNKPISTATQDALDALDEDKSDKTNIATVESGTTASRAYSVGELVYVNGTLYRVKTAIASGATFTVGTNIEAKNVSDALDYIAERGIKRVYNQVVSVDSNGFANITSTSVLPLAVWAVASMNILASVPFIGGDGLAWYCKFTDIYGQPYTGNLQISYVYIEV